MGVAMGVAVAIGVAVLLVWLGVAIEQWVCP